MLSAHDFATLMLVKWCADQIADQAELDTLLERQLVVIERLGPKVTLGITRHGDALLRALERIH